MKTKKFFHRRFGFSSKLFPFSFFLFTFDFLLLTFLAFTFSFFLLPFDFAFADASSASFGLSEDRFTGGGGNASSANYQLAETSIEPFSGTSLSSTNYAVAPKVGINASTNIVSINAVSPASPSRHYSDENASFAVTAVDPDSDTLQYRAKEDSTIKAGPQASSTLTWALGSSDLGRHTMNLEVIDPDGTVVKQQPAYVFRRPVK